MLDTKGPEIRTGFFKEGIKAIQLKKGQTLEISNYKRLNERKYISESPLFVR